jgi:hypothetical protein
VGAESTGIGRPAGAKKEKGSLMADKPMDVYLNDHLGGATLGSDLAAPDSRSK